MGKVDSLPPLTDRIDVTIILKEDCIWKKAHCKWSYLCDNCQGQENCTEGTVETQVSTRAKAKAEIQQSWYFCGIPGPDSHSSMNKYEKNPSL